MPRSQKAGIELDGLKVSFKRIGGGGKVDGVLIVESDATINGVTFKSGSVIAIIEMESTIKEGEDLEDLCMGAYANLKKHIKLSGYENVPYGISIGFFYDPEEALAGEPGTPPLIKVYARSELEG
ncbi:MAG: hypothetical protein JTT13_04620 [Candidatus Brockarchaeota archaeon]|nr:hypothetical protein [Candidatus Brockarchaeota archaeon]